MYWSSGEASTEVAESKGGGREGLKVVGNTELQKAVMPVWYERLVDGAMPSSWRWCRRAVRLLSAEQR